MDDKLQKWKKKFNNVGRIIAEDIRQVVGNMKRIVHILEDIAKQFKAQLLYDTNDTKRNEEGSI